MKKIVIYLIAMILVVPAGAQTLFDELVNKYVDVEGFSAVQLTNDMFELYLKKKNIDADDPVYDVLNDLDNMMVITQIYSDDEESSGDEIKQEIRNYYQDNGYTLFKTEKNANSDLKIYIEKSDDGIESMGLLSSNSFSLNLIEMNGKIDLSKVASLSRALNIRGLEQLRVFDNNTSPDNFYFNYEYAFPYSNSLKLSDETRAKIEEQVQRAREEMKKNQGEMMLRQKELTEKQKELYEKYQRFPIMISGSDSKDAEYFVDGEKVTIDEIREIDPQNVESIQVNKKDNDKKTPSQILIKLKNSK